MPVFTTEVFDEGLGHSFESRIEGTNDEKGTQRLEVTVPEGSPLLVITVSDLDQRSAMFRILGKEPFDPDRGPSNVNVSIRPPENADIEARELVSKGGKIIFAIENPPPGKWIVFAEYQPNSSARINIAAFGKRFWQRLRELPAGAACRTCHVFLKGTLDIAIAAAVVHSLPLGAAAAAVEAAIRGFYGKGPIEFAFEKIVEVLLGYADSPLELLVHRVCALFGACPKEI